MASDQRRTTSGRTEAGRTVAGRTARGRTAGFAATAILGLVVTLACSGADDNDDGGSEAAPTTSAPESTAPDDASETTAPGAGEEPDPSPTQAPPEATDEPGAPDQDPEPTDEPTDEPERPAAGSVSIGAAGDILPHARVIENGQSNAAASGESGYDFSPMFAQVTDALSEPDISMCHLETPLSADNSNLTAPRTLVFNTPREMAGALAGAGFDGCDFASNHTFDQGLTGVSDTADVLADAGLEYAGPAATEEEAGSGAWYEVQDIAVAQFAYSYTLLNQGEPNTIVPEGAPWMEQYLWLERGAEGIIADAEQARDDGADFVVVSMHWGQEYQAAPTDQQRELATELLESEAVDLILGTHVHVVQPCEEINGRYVLYGMGNFLSNQSPSQDPNLLPGTQDGMIAQVELTRDEDGEVSSTLAVQPTFVNIQDHVIQPVSPESNPESYDRTISALTSLGAGSCSFDTPVG